MALRQAGMNPTVFTDVTGNLLFERQLAWRLPTRWRRAVRLPVTGPSTPLPLGSGSAGLGALIYEPNSSTRLTSSAHYAACFDSSAKLTGDR